MEFLKNSVTFKILAKLWAFLSNAWEYSLLKKLFEGFSRGYDNSRLKKAWERFYMGEDPAVYSVYGKFLAWLEEIFLYAGGFLKKSLVYRLVQAVRNGWLKLAEKSVILKAVSSLSLTRWMLLVFAAYLPVEYLLRDVLGIGLSSYWEELFILAAAALVIWKANFKEHQGAISRASSVEVCMILFMMVGLLLMVLNMPYPYIAIAGYRAQVEYMVWFMLILRLLDTREDARFMICAFLGVVALMSLHGIYQFIIGVPIPASWVSATESAVRTRVFSLCGSPNIFGCLLLLAAPIAAALMYYCKETKYKLFFLCVTGLICLCDLFTFCKGSWVGLVVAVIIFAMFVDKRIIALMAAGVSMILISFPSVANRIAYLFTNEYKERSALAGRTMRWNAGLKLLKLNGKWLGFGLGRFGGAVAMNNQVIEKTETFSYFYMDNYYLKVLVEMGIVGLVFYIILLLSMALAGFRACGRCGRHIKEDRTLDPLVRNTGNDRILCAGVLSGLCGVLVHCYYENIFEEPYMMAYFWGLTAALLFLGIYAKPQDTGRTEDINDAD